MGQTHKNPYKKALCSYTYIYTLDITGQLGQWADIFIGNPWVFRG